LTNATGLPLTTGVSGQLPIANGGTGATSAISAFNALAPSQTGNSGYYLTTNGTNASWAAVSGGGGGTVTSVGLSAPGFLSVGGTPVTSSGTLALSYSGTALPAANGGTGQITYTDGQLLIGNSSGNTLTKSTLTAGSNITITNGNGSITIASTGGGSSGPVLESYQTISSSYSITAGSNAFSVGPVTVSAGVTVTVPTGQIWLIAA
jgi:hypothetical protein